MVSIAMPAAGTMRVSMPPSEPSHNTGTPSACSAMATAMPGKMWPPVRSEEHTSELQSLMRISYAVFCLKKKKLYNIHNNIKHKYNSKHTIHINYAHHQ